MILKKSRISSWLKPGIRRSRDPMVVRRSRWMRPDLMMMEGRTLLSTFTVTSTADDGSAGTLRWAIDQANANHQANTIEFSSTVFSTPQTIKLSAGSLELSDTAGLQAIRAPAAGVTINGQHQSRVFTIGSNVTASLWGTTITGGKAVLVGSNEASYGGGLRVSKQAHVTLTDCVISGNTAQNPGGGVFSSGTVQLVDCTVSDNASVVGGGLTNAGGTLELLDTTVCGNSVESVGGGIENGGTLILTNSTISGNSAEFGAGVDNIDGGKAQLICTTVSGNSGRDHFVRVAAGIYNQAGSTVTLTDTIVAGNTSNGRPSDIEGNVSGNHNLIGTGGSGGLENGVDGNLVGVADPGLTPLGDYGGPTRTVALVPGSPAIGAGTSGPGLPTVDQRGFARGTSVDIGAVQTQASLVVNTTADGVGSDPGQLSLRQAVNLANVLRGPNNIGFDPTLFASRQTITLTAGELDLTNRDGAEEITGPAAGVTISGNNRSRVLEIGPGVTAMLSAITMTAGHATNGGGLLTSSGSDVRLTACTISNNSADNEGGGLWVAGDMSLVGCSITANTGIAGGGLEDASEGTISLTNVTVSGNKALVAGGGLETSSRQGTLSLTDVTVSGNKGSWGGGLALDDVDGVVTLQNVTIAGNSAVLGGGLFIDDGISRIEGGTISGNVASSSGGGLQVQPTATATLTDTIVAGNSHENPNTHQATPNDIQGAPLQSGSFNLIGTGGSGGLRNGVDGNLVGVANPGLAALGSYGGTTQTIALLPGSSAIDAGTSGPGIPDTDQRGEPRHGAPDIGAFESQGFTLTIVPGSSPQRTAVGAPFAHPLAVVVMADNPIEPVVGGTVIFLVPDSGASAVLSPAETVGIDQAGRASVTAVANMIVGEYPVTAVTLGAAPVAFDLTNTAAAAGADVALGGALSLEASAAAAPGRFAHRASGATVSVAANVVDEVLGDLAGDASTALDVDAMALDQLNAPSRGARHASRKN
jgi:hypothetical protein